MSMHRATCTTIVGKRNCARLQNIDINICVYRNNCSFIRAVIVKTV